MHNTNGNAFDDDGTFDSFEWLSLSYRQDKEQLNCTVVFNFNERTFSITNIYIQNGCVYKKKQNALEIYHFFINL